MKQFILVQLLLFLGLVSLAQDMPAYKIYNSKGKKTSYRKMIKTLEKSDIVLFGELHNNPIAHWLQLEVTKSLNERDSLILGAEMMEADNQYQLDQYLAGDIDQKGLDSLARLWSNYSTDYAPLVNYAKNQHLKFVATNIPRRNARLVHRGGFEALDTLADQEKAWIAPLPIAFDSTLPQYQNILDMMGDHGTMDLVRAQAIKDATMAHFILQEYRDDAIFLHFNGAYHSNFYEGIVWYLKEARSELTYRTITTVSQEDVGNLLEEHRGKADFVICVDADMTTTY